MNEYLTPSKYNLRIYGLFHAHEDGDLLLAMAFLEEYDGRCLIEILALQTSTPNLKNALKKEIIASFFVELVNIQRNLVKAVHLRVPSGLQGLSAEIFADLSLKLPKENIAVKTLKQTLATTVSFFEIPCFSNDPKFYEIIHVIHELGFKINDKPPKLRSYLSLEAATKNYIGQLTNEIVVNGNSTKIITSKNNAMVEIGSEEKPLSILSITDLLQAMEEMHLKFTDIQSCCYSTFKIVSFFGDPRLESLPKAKSVDSGYSSLSSPSSSTVSMNYGFSAAASADEKEVKVVEKKFCPSPISSASSTPAAKKRKLESPCLTVSKIVNSMYSACFYEQERSGNGSPNLCKTTPSTLPINSDSPDHLIDTTSLSVEEVDETIPPCPMVSWDISSSHVKQEENEYSNFCIYLPPAIDSISSTIILPIPSICDGQKEESSITPSIITSSSPYANENNLEEIFLNDQESPIDLSVSNDINQEEDKIGIPDTSILTSPKFDKQEDSEIRSSPFPTVPCSLDPTSSTNKESEQVIRSSTPGPDILNLLPSIKSSLPILSPDEEKEREANQKPLPKEHAQLCDIALRYLELEKAQNDLIKNCVSSKLERNSALNILTSFYNNNYSN
uniref:Uncharacterized protein n=1 Tax=Panagrolaimus sp. ES5 TaxID=591445 RepID=A0AC34GRR4_9BILA